MRKFLASAAIVFTLAGTVQAQDFDKGWKAYEAGDYATALQQWRPLAEQGHPNAQFNLGVMHLKGQGVLQDYLMAHMWYNIASANGYEAGASGRDYIARRFLTAGYISNAQVMAEDCMSSNYQNCGD
ncbi:MAG: sel1 repeat family protein [Paracoccaceae bacterium]|nr:sel1 repeat family protein [Paracoccaceae bacterium]